MKTIIGAYLIDAPFSALNNSGLDKRAGTENGVSTKTIQSPEGIRPYVSAQAVRYWMRNILESKYQWKMSPVEKIEGKSQAITKANPLAFEDDDMFGYMSARKVQKEGSKKAENVTVTRVSPFKCSPLLGFPIRPNEDFGVMNRKYEGDAVPFTHQFYSNILKGIFAIDIDSAGVFTSYNKPGSQNLSQDLVKEYTEKGLKVGDTDKFCLPVEERKKRITDILQAYKYLNGGAMQTLHLTDVTPKAIILACINSGNNIFMDVFPHKDYKNGLISIDALTEVIKDYKDDFLTDIYIGWMSDFGTDVDKELQTIESLDGIKINVSSPVQAIDAMVDELNTKANIFGE